MRRLATLTLIAAAAAALALPAQAQGFRGPGYAGPHGGYGYGAPRGYGHGRGYGYGRGAGLGVAAGAAVAGFAIGAATGAVAGGYGPGYDYVETYPVVLPSNERYGYTFTAPERASFAYPATPELTVESGWYGY